MKNPTLLQYFHWYLAEALLAYVFLITTSPKQNQLSAARCSHMQMAHILLNTEKATIRSQ